MRDEDDLEVTWHTGLYARLDCSFPKKCMNCGRVFHDVEQYFTETADINERDRGLKSYVDDDDDTATVVEAFRNCPCGSTLMEMFDDHRDEFQEQMAQRKKPEEIAQSVRVDDPFADKAPPAAPAKPKQDDWQPLTAQEFNDELNIEFTEMFADDPGPWNDAWYEGLRPSGDDAFPKKCQNCSRIYETPDDFFQETANVREDETGLRQALEEGASVHVEAYRNCACGSTLMDCFTDRRDVSSAGQERRENFGRLLTFLTESGIDQKTAREELLKVVRGGKSKILANIKPPD